MIDKPEHHVIIFSERGDMWSQTMGNMKPISGAIVVYGLLSTQNEEQPATDNDKLYYSLSVRGGIVYG